MTARKSLDIFTDEIIDSLSQHLADELTLIGRVNRMGRKKRGKFVRDIIALLTHIDFGEEEAWMHWENVIEHASVLQQKFDRQIGLRVAMLDYFQNIARHLDNPKFIEIDEYGETLKRTLIDPLTGLFNRRYLQKFLNKEVKRSKRYKLIFSILMLDIDNFKTYNDTYGHLAGDKALCEIASVLTGDSRGEDVAIRYGGEEFIDIMPHTDKEGAKIKAERLRKKIETFTFGFDEKKEKAKLTVSGGVSTYPFDSEESELLIELSDKALYRAKALGKNRIC